MSDTCVAPDGTRPFSFGMEPRTLIFVATGIACMPLTILILGPLLFRFVGKTIGWALIKKTEGRRALLVSLMDEDNKKSGDKSPSSKSSSSSDEWEKVQSPAADLDKKITNPDWDGIIGFFHPFCNAGGGGERVLWAAIRATQTRWPKAKCAVYTGDHDVTKDQILNRVSGRFNIHLNPATVTFIYLSKRHWVLASTWPQFTLLGQSIGSLILGWDAFSLLVPDIFIDTMGYAFVSAMCTFLFPKVPTGAYVHYPTISTDMLESLDSTDDGHGVNAGQGTGNRGKLKRFYWQMFAHLYSWLGSSIDVVMTNSTWTQNHIKKLWGPYREEQDKNHPIAVVYPPVAVEEVEEEVEVSEASEKNVRQPVIICIAQFRPEKNHTLILQSFADFLKTGTKAAQKAKLVLVGSVRDDSDSKRVYKLRLLANELGIKDRVEFHLDATWPEILEWLRKASVGVNGMWNEHFGIGVVEYQAAGLISVVHDSAGPKLDIVVKVDGQPTGFHATSATEFAEGYEKALSLENPLEMRLRARRSAKRFTEAEFARKWVAETERLISLRK